jgi:hypothetical protein
MGIIHIMERGGSELYEYKRAVKMAKEAIDTICDLTDEMEDKFSSRGGASYRDERHYDDYEERSRSRYR